MQITHLQSCRHDRNGQIVSGRSTWNDGEEMTVKYCYPDKNGRTARTSPEISGPILLELLEVALSQGVVGVKDVAAVLHKAL